MIEEGGYYAIKGFSYQYMVSLIEVLTCSDENKEFGFEQLQDFNDDKFIYQMKYKETQHYTNSKIKEPTIKIFLEYLETKKDYILYVYFPDKADETVSFNTVEELDRVLLNCKIDKKVYSFTKEQKEEFIKHFTIIFSKDYIDKSNELVEIVSRIMKVTKDVAEIYCLCLVTYIINIIVNNESENRNCTKRKLIGYLVKSSTKIFYEYSMKYYGKEKYLKCIKREYFFEKNINDYNRLFIINVEFTSIDDYYDCICKVTKRFYITNKKKTMTISRAPYIYLPNIKSDDLVKLKEKLFETLNFVDGYMYKDSKFNVEYMTKKFPVKSNISCKLINTEDDLAAVVDKLKDDGVRIYQFYDDNHRSICKTYEAVSIKVDEINDICKII